MKVLGKDFSGIPCWSEPKWFVVVPFDDTRQTKIVSAVKGSRSSQKKCNLYYRGLMPLVKAMELACVFHCYTSIGFMRF